MKITVKTTLTALALTLLPVLAHANLIVNGDFESPSVASGSFKTLTGTALTGWTAGANGVEVRNHVAGDAFSGTQYVELDSTGNSSISQDIATRAGRTYLVSFAYSPRSGIAADSNEIDVFWNGVSIAQITGNGVGQAGNVWSRYSFFTVATGATSTLRFEANGKSDSLGGSLDAVSVNVPEPGMLGLLGIGLLGFGVSRRRKGV